jgi:serine/threonine-protein kinase
VSGGAARSRAFAGSERYVLGERIAVGGMAEIYLAHLRGDLGFDKEVVIKRLRPELAADHRLLDLFRDEARITAQLHHPHTIHVFDSGVLDGLPFMAMERIEGDELNVVCRRGLTCGEFLPLEHAVELVRQAALGMGYYHNLRDTSGEELHLVHCDVSPNNLLVSRDGYLQIIDFGIGQFRGQTYRDGEMVPGKLSYMSPEQARRDPLDRRSDIFSLGIILYEITLGRRLFRGRAQEILPRIIACDVQPPTFVRQDYPGALESIVMRTLEAEPAERYQDAYDLADALGEYLREERMRSGVVGVARYLDRLNVAQGGERRDELISEAELAGEEEALDFDRGLFSGFEAVSKADPDVVASWDDFGEDEQLVAQALGIDVSLVRTSARLPTQPSMRRIRESAPPPVVESDAAAPAPERPAAPAFEHAAAQPAPEGRSSAAQAWLWLLIGLVIGAGGALALSALS